MKKHEAVQIDTRLSDLFFARRRGEVTDESPEEPVASADLSTGVEWLTQFQSISDSNTKAVDSPNISVVSTFQVKRSNVRPFWAPEDIKLVRSSWKKSKSMLMKDCQKQRKAALRKTSSK